MSQSKEPVEESGGGWFDWWPRPVITSRTVLGAALLGVVCLGFLMVGIGLLFSPVRILGVGTPSFGIVCLVVAAAIGWVAYRMVRRVAWGTLLSEWSDYERPCSCWTAAPL